MRFTSLGSADEIGASCHLLEVMGHHILVDCGLRPTAVGPAALPDLNALSHPPDLVLVTHAHLDHSGALPLLHQRFPQAPILVSHATHALLKILLTDAVQVMGYNRHLAEPLYDMKAVKRLLHSLTAQATGRWFRPLPDVAACLALAGHILGAVMVLLDTPEGRVAFSGDVSLAHQRTVRGVSLPDFTADLLVLESTYGAAQHAGRADEEKALARQVAQVVVDGGVALVPSFAVGRAQEVILCLRAMQRAGAIPEFPIYVDGMVRAVCGAYRQRYQDLSPELQELVASGVHPFKDKWVRAVNSHWRDQIPRPDEPCCIVSSSGMLTGGPSVGYARRIVGDPRNAILFPGYTDEESPGRKLQAIKPGDELEMEGQSVIMKAQVERVNLSAHADGPQLTQLTGHLRPRAVILVHGEPESREALGELLGQRYPVHLPLAGERIEPLSPPHWLGEVEGSRRHPGRVNYTDEQVTIGLARSLLGEPAWSQHYLGQDEVAARFLGERLVIEPGKVGPEIETSARPLVPVEEKEVKVLVKTEAQKMADKWYDSKFACIMCGGLKRYRVDLSTRQVEWTCAECGAGYAEMIMRLRDKDLHKLDANEQLRLLQFIRVSLRLHEPVLPDNWGELVAQRFWERWLEEDA